MLDAEPVRQGARDPVGFLLTALLLPCRRKWDRYNHVHTIFFRIARDNLRKPIREPVSEPRHLFVLHQGNRVVQRLVIEAEAPRPSEGECLPSTEAAERSRQELLLAGHCRKWSAAARA